MIGRKLEEILRGWTPRWRPLRFRITLAALVVAAIVVPLALLGMPYLEIFNDMAVQPKGKTQGYYGWYAGRSLVVERAPVAGTVAMGQFPYPIEGEGEEATKRAEAVLENPLSPTLETLERGKKLFEVFCIVCHGERAEGNGSIVGPNLFPAPPSLHTSQARAFLDGRIYHVITKGQNKMPSYADRLEPEERWSVVHYVRALQRAMLIDPEERDR
jgi:mono/diheme cytochrome c family protein